MIGVRAALWQAVRERGKDPRALDPWYFPRVEEYKRVSTVITVTGTRDSTLSPIAPHRGRIRTHQHRPLPTTDPPSNIPLRLAANLCAIVLPRVIR